MEKCAGASGHQNSRNPCFLIQVTGTLQKWSDGLFFPADYPLHKGIPYHKIGCRGILIQQENMASRLDSLHNSSCLGSTSAGILCGKTTGVFFVWKIIDEQGNIHILYKSSVLRTQLLGSGIGNHIFPAIPLDMIVYAQFQSIQKGRFAVIASADNQSDSFRNSHACDPSFVRKLHGHPQAFRGRKVHAVFHRSGRNSAFSWQNRAIVYKSRKGTSGNLLTDKLLIFCQKYGIFQIFST